MTSSSFYAGHRFPPELISYTVWLYYRFPLSLRMVEEMLAFRGIEVSHETIRQWGLKFGQEFANIIRQTQATNLPRFLVLSSMRCPSTLSTAEHTHSSWTGPISAVQVVTHPGLVPSPGVGALAASSHVRADKRSRCGVAVDTVIGVKRQSGLRDNFWLFQSLALCCWGAGQPSSPRADLTGCGA
jgi:hypothetical protein